MLRLLLQSGRGDWSEEQTPPEKVFEVRYLGSRLHIAVRSFMGPSMCEVMLSRERYWRGSRCQHLHAPCLDPETHNAQAPSTTTGSAD